MINYIALELVIVVKTKILHE